MGEIIKMVAEYGAAAVCIGIFLWLNIKRDKKLDKRELEQDKRQKELDEKYDYSQKLLNDTLAKIIENTKHNHTLDEEQAVQKINSCINGALDHLRRHTNANRVCCFMYHNGGYSITGTPFLKMSMNFEIPDESTAQVMGSYQNVPRTMFQTLIEKIAKDGYYYISNIEDIKESDPITRQSLSARGMKSAYIRVIKNANENLLGFVSVEFRDIQENEEYIEEKLKTTVVKISGLLESKDAFDD